MNRGGRTKETGARLRYHPLDDGSRVVGFYVEPFTVAHRFQNDASWDGSGEAPALATCDKSGPMVYEAIAAKQKVEAGPVLFTSARPRRRLPSRTTRPRGRSAS